MIDDLSVCAAKRMLRERAARRSFLDGLADGFGEPAWDILLCLYAEGQEEGRWVRFDLVKEAAGSERVAEAFLRFLASQGAIERDDDGPRSRVALTATTRVRMQAYLEAQQATK